MIQNEDRPWSEEYDGQTSERSFGSHMEERLDKMKKELNDYARDVRIYKKQLVQYFSLICFSFRISLRIFCLLEGTTSRKSSTARSQRRDGEGYQKAPSPFHYQIIHYTYIIVAFDILG